VSGRHFGAKWIADRWIVFRSADGIAFVVDSRTKEVRELLSIPRASIGSFDVSPDGRRLFFVRASQEGDIWLATLDQPTP
jgi:dipeptidyl aminopeptidase/acylaminoacyl peptidase